APPVRPSCDKLVERLAGVDVHVNGKAGRPLGLTVDRAVEAPAYGLLALPDLTLLLMLPGVPRGVWRRHLSSFEGRALGQRWSQKRASAPRTVGLPGCLVGRPGSGSGFRGAQWGAPWRRAQQGLWW